MTLLTAIAAIVKRLAPSRPERRPPDWETDPEAAERMTARVATLMERAIQGEALTEDEVYGCLDEDGFMTPRTAIAWHALSHWWCDDDWRLRDPDYAEWQLNQITECLASLGPKAARHD